MEAAHARRSLAGALADRMKRTVGLTLLFTLLAACRSISVVADAERGGASHADFRIEASPDPTTFEGGSLATVDYEPTDIEATFRDIAPDPYRRVEKGGPATLDGYRGKRVGWFGIIRRVEEVESAGRTRVLMESKYFDGLTDEDLQVVSIRGAGDFIANIPGTGHGLKLLGLARIIGVVENEKASVPELRAEYVRTWGWGQFTFMAYGVDHSSQAWVERRRLSDDAVYSRRMTTDYYEQLLGIEGVEE